MQENPSNTPGQPQGDPQAEQPSIGYLQHPSQPLGQPQSPQQPAPIPQQAPQYVQPQAAASVPPSAPAPAAPPKADYLHPIMDPPKHTYHPKRVILTLTVAVIVCVLLVAALVLYAIRPQQMPAETEQKPDESSETLTPLTSSDTLQHLTPHFKESVAAQQVISLPVIAPKKTFYTVIPDVTPVAGIASTVTSNQAKTTLDAILKSFEKDSFKKMPVRELTDPTGYLAYFTRDDVICQTTVSPVNVEANTQVIEADCLDMTVYTEYANVQQTYVDLYTPSASSSIYVAFVGKPVIKPSQSAGYNTTEIPVSTVIEGKLTSAGTVAMFYQSPDQLWHYFLDRDSSLLVDCSKYKLPATLYSYAGQTCSISGTSKNKVIVAPKAKK